MYKKTDRKPSDKVREARENLSRIIVAEEANAIEQLVVKARQANEASRHLDVYNLGSEIRAASNRLTHAAQKACIVTGQDPFDCDKEDASESPMHTKALSDV